MPIQPKIKIYRIIDANINRLKEGLRVCEDIIRFVLDDHGLWLKFKNARHSIFTAAKNIAPRYSLIESRQTKKDIGKKTTKQEIKRRDFQHIFFANIQRAKESLRVLEEFSKLLDKKQALKFKKIRYMMYSLEQEATKKLHSLFTK